MTRNIAETVVVVGDRFEGIAQHDGVLTLSQVLKVAQSHPDQLPDNIIVGQGIGSFDLIALNTAVDEHRREPRPRIAMRDMELASRLASHKSRPQNVLIANLSPTERLAAHAELTIENDNELLLDHQTGQHVQGMVIVEASRQMLLAATTCLRLIDDLREPYFVIENMNTQFLSFLFPLPASLRFATREPDCSRPGSAGFKAIIEIEQNGVTVSKTDVAYTVFTGERIHQIESRKAAKALSALASRTAEGTTLA